MNDSDQEIVLAFLEESHENLDRLDEDLVALEVNPSDPLLLSQVFRTIHTIKGTCGFLGFHRLEALTHAGENLLGALRDGELDLDGPVTTSLLGLVDAVRRTLELIARTGTEGDEAHLAVIADLHRHLAGPTAVGIADGEATAPASAAAVRSATETTVRVDVAVLDKLMDLVGELVLARSQFAESPATGDDGELSAPYRQLRVVTSELQEGVMQARLQPVGTATSRLRRVVRDVAASMGKQVGVEIEGEEIGVDKAVNEALRDPLMHLVRNAVDHGIERPDERIAAGKPPRGSLTLRVFQESGRVHIDVADDGRGVDVRGLIDKAVATGVLTHDDAMALDRDDVLDLMFRPGLSTKDVVTNVSGRGVGLDVVRSALQHVGGSIEVSSEPGRGTTFRLTVPLTLAIMPVLIASAGAQRYAVPQVDVQEVVQVAVDDRAATVHHIDGALVLRLRDRLLPLVDLADQLRLERARTGDDLTVVVVETAGRRFGIVVDGVGDATEVVVKPLTRATRSIRLFGGVTILADGEPSLILDVGGVAATVGITATPALAAVQAGAEPEDLGSTLLLMTGADGGRLAVEMAVVRRLEQIPVQSVERSGRVEVVADNGGILPLIRVADLLPYGAPAGHPSDVLDAVICDSSVGPVGLVVGHIEDVVARPAAAPQPPGRRGVLVSLVVDERVTEVLDVEALVAAAGLGRPA